ncbi:MAG: Lrp/AsnC family transcriptional regulator [Pseudooceanicola sp.]
MQALDKRDLAILRAVAANGRITKAALAEEVGLSPSPCWTRLKRLEESGLIESYGARISLRRFAPHVVVFVTVELAEHNAATFQGFERAIARQDEVTACWALGGGFDYLLQIITRDIESYQTLIDDLLEARIGVVRYFSYVVTKQVKSRAAPPLELLFPGADQIAR